MPAEGIGGRLQRAAHARIAQIVHPKGKGVLGGGGDAVARGERGLGRCPDRELSVGDASQRGMRFQRRVCDITLLESAVETRLHAARFGLDVAAFAERPEGRGLHDQVGEDRFRIETRRRRFGGRTPLRGNLPQGGLGGLRVGMQHRHQIILFHDHHPVHGLRGRGVRVQQAGAMDRCARQPRMQHAGQPHIGGVAGGSCDLLESIEARRRGAEARRP